MVNNFDLIEKSESIDDKIESNAITAKRELADLNSENINLIREVEKKEEKYFGSNESITGLWNDAVKNLRVIYAGQDVGSTKRKAYDFMKKFNVDMDARYFVKQVNKCEVNCDKIKQKLDFVNEKLNSTRGKKGLKVVLEEQRDVAEGYANLFVNTKNFIQEYTSQIAMKKSELKQLKIEQEKDEHKSFGTEIKYLNTQIRDIEKEKLGMISSLDGSASKLREYDHKIDTKKAMINSIEIVYTKGTSVYNKLKSKIEIAKDFVANNKLIDSGLISVVKDLEEMANDSINLTQSEGELGNVLVKTTKIINNRIGNIQIEEEGLTYRTEIEKGINQDHLELSQALEEKVAKYATLPYN